MRKRLLWISMLLIIIMEIITGSNKNAISTSSVVPNQEPVKVGVFLSSFSDPYVSLIQKGLEEIQKQNQDKVQYTFFDGKGNQTLQNRELTALLKKKEINLVLLNLVEQEGSKYCIDRIKESNIPVILFGPRDLETIKSYKKAYWVGTDATEGGILQGKMLIDLWNDQKGKVDRNKDNVMQYIMLEGPSDNIYAVERTKNSIIELNYGGIQTEKLASKVCNWSEEEAHNATKAFLLQLGNKIEMIIANNDSMAIGAVKALQEYGYNHGEKTTTIPVVGFDGIPEARNLIEKGFMTGTVVQDPYDSSKAFYTIGFELINNKTPVSTAEYKVDESGALVILHYEGVMVNLV